MSRETRNKIRQLRKHIDDLSDEQLARIYMVMKVYIDAYANQTISQDQWLEGLDEIVDIFYNSFEETYAETSKALSKIYKKVEKFNVDKVDDLIYQKDGKTLNERLAMHWNEAEFKLKAGVSKKDALKTLLYRFTVVLNTESRNIEETVKKHKKPVPEPGQYIIQVIEGCGGDCGVGCTGYNGIFAEDDDVPWPPYHPNCQGIAYYDITDDPDEIEDLGLDEGDLDEGGI